MEFMTDNFAIVSRDVMDHYTSMADGFESCIPTAPPREPVRRAVGVGRVSSATSRG